MPKKEKRKRRTKKIGPFTQGQLNRVIDDLLHPKFAEGKQFIIIDGAAHAVLEGDILVSAKKFLKYNLLPLPKGSKKKKKGEKDEKSKC